MKRVFECESMIDDVAGNGPGRYGLPRLRMPFDSRNEGLNAGQ